MIGHLQQKCTLALVLACFVAVAAALACGKDKNQSSSDLFSCPASQEDAMQYFVMRKDLRENHYLSGEANPSYTKIFPDVDFAATGYWFWLKSPEAHGFDIKAFDEKYIYIRSTELEWKDNSTFKRKEQDNPLTTRCVPLNGASPVERVSNARFSFYANCKPYKTSSLGTIVDNLDAPEMMDAGGDIGQVLTRVLHYRFNCDKMPGVIPMPSRKSMRVTIVPLVANKIAMCGGDLPSETCSASSIVPTFAWCSRCPRPSELRGLCRSQRW